METEISRRAILDTPLADWRRYIGTLSQAELLRLRDRLDDIAALARICGPRRPLGKANRRYQAVKAELEAPG